MSLPSWWGSQLGCGCIRGVKLCDQGERLWDNVADAHSAMMRVWFEAGDDDVTKRDEIWRRRRELQADHQRTTAGYESALAAFTAHVEIEAETAVQATML